MQLCIPNAPAMAVATVMITLRIVPQLNFDLLLIRIKC